MTSVLFSISSDWSLLFLRLVLGFIFLWHGWPKIKNLKETWQGFAMMGFKPGVLWGTIVATAEFFGSLLLLAGLFVSVSALILAVQMLVATLWKLRRGQKLVSGYELDLLLVVSLLAVATLGGGVYSLDNYLQ